MSSSGSTRPSPWPRDGCNIREQRPDAVLPTDHGVHSQDAAGTAAGTYLYKVADLFIAVQRQISPKHQQDDRWRRGQGRPRRGCQQTLLVRRKEDEKHYLELDGLDDVTEDAFKAESGKTNVSLTCLQSAIFQSPEDLRGRHREQHQFDTFSESILEQGDKDLWSRRVSQQVDQ